MMPLPQPVKLSLLGPGARGVVSGFSDLDRPKPLSGRMMEMGLTIGAKVEVIHESPFGGAIAVRCRGTRIALRTTDAEAVELLPESALS